MRINGKSELIAVNSKLYQLVLRKNRTVINDGQIPFSDCGKVLGVKIWTTGYNKHVHEISQKGKLALRELWRFYTLPHNIKPHLIKAFIRPQITYAPIPMVTISNTNLKNYYKIKD